MSKNSEVGHAKNVANFLDLISFCESYEGDYNPNREPLKLTSLFLLHTEGKAALADVIAKKTTFNNETNLRRETFAVIKPLTARIFNFFEITDASPNKIEDAKSLKKKIQGVRITKKKTATATDDDSELPPDKSISTSQQSYDQLIQHFAALISILESEPSYNPNETILKVANLKNLLQKMETTTENVMHAFIAINKSRDLRNDILYNREYSICNTAREVKKYVRAAFGFDSTAYKNILSIKFSIVK